MNFSCIDNIGVGQNNVKDRTFQFDIRFLYCTAYVFVIISQYVQRNPNFIKSFISLSFKLFPFIFFYFINYISVEIKIHSICFAGVWLKFFLQILVNAFLLFRSKSWLIQNFQLTVFDECFLMEFGRDCAGFKHLPYFIAGMLQLTNQFLDHPTNFEESLQIVHLTDSHYN